MGSFYSKKFKRTKKYNSHKIFFLSVGNKDDYNEVEHSGHITLREIFKVNFSSHIQDILSDSTAKILDVGCGLGFWLMEMAADFQKPSYFGIDVLPTFPTSTVPSNIKFQQHNLLNGLPYDDNTFDFVHIQILSFDITEIQWETIVFQELARVLKPGGWLEICDIEYGILNCGPITKKYDLLIIDNLKSRGINPHLILRSHSILKTIPTFSSSVIHHKKRKYPLGSFTNKLGELCAKNMKLRFKAILESPIGKDLNIKRRDVDSIVDKMTKEFETNKSFFYVHRVYVQKNIV